MLTPEFLFHQNARWQLTLDPHAQSPSPAEAPALAKALTQQTEGERTLSFANLEDRKAFWEAFQQAFTIIPAAGGLVLNEADDVLLIHRRGKWDLPKGKIDEGEKPREAAIREVQEETGVQHLEDSMALPLTWHVYPLPEKHGGPGWALKPTYWYWMRTPGQPVLTPQAEEDIAEAVWIPWQALDVRNLDTYPSLRHLLLLAKQVPM